MTRPRHRHLLRVFARPWLLMCLAVLPGASAAELRASIEPRIVDELDTARITIRHTGTNQATRLDLDALASDFEVLTTQSSSQYRSVNGQVESWVDYQIMVRPRRAGDLTVPPIEVGGERTEPLSLRVRGIEPELRDAIDRMVFFETELTRNPVYVQAETVMIRRLYYSSGAQIYSDLPGMPEIDDAVVKPLGETTSRTVIADGQRYGIIEQRFSIVPEESGTLTIPAISVTSSVRLQAGGRSRRSGVRVATEPVALEVLPVPPEYPADAPWLPAQAVNLVDDWSPDLQRPEVGEPLRRTLRAQVEGNVSSVIPPLDPGFPDGHFRHYPEPPELNDDASGARVRGTRTQTYAVIPTHPGSVSLPAPELVWWDVNDRQVRTARAPARAFEITGVPPAAPEAPSPVPAAAPPPSERLDPAADTPPPDAAAWRRTGFVVAGLLTLAAAAAAGAWWWRKRRRAPGEPGASVRWRRLRAACRRDDPVAMHDALLAFLQAHFRASPPEAVRRFRAAGHGSLLDRLNADLYRPAASDAVTGRELLSAARSLHDQDHASRREPLPGLYD